MGMSHENVEGGAFQTEGSTRAKALQEEFACLKNRGRARGLEQGGWWRPSYWPVTRSDRWRRPDQVGQESQQQVRSSLCLFIYSPLGEKSFLIHEKVV